MTIDNLKVLLAPLQSKPIVDFLDQVDALAQQNAANAERLAQAMKRESELKQQLAESQKQLAEAQKQLTEAQKLIYSMKEHPAVKAAERERLAREINALQQRHDQLGE